MSVLEIKGLMSNAQRILSPQFPDVRLRHSPNWTIAIFLALLGGVHLAIALRAALYGRWEGYLSFIFGAIFLAAGVVTIFVRREIVIQASRNQIVVRFGMGTWVTERFIPFSEVSAVKLTLTAAEGPIKIVCIGEELECPPTRVPRPEALLLAMMLGVKLIKIGGGTPEESSVNSPSQLT